MKVVPLVKEKTGPRLAYYISRGVRYADQDWKRLLNGKIAENQDAINKLLARFGVPLLDGNDHPLAMHYGCVSVKLTHTLVPQGRSD
jgi:hypothetical protein